MKRAVALAALALLAAWDARAHPLAPALLELEELEAPGRFAMRWKTPRADDALTPILPASCETVSSARGDFEAGGYVRASEVQCGAAGLIGATARVGGLDASGSDALVRIHFADGRSVRALLRPDAPSLQVPARESSIGLFVSHLRHGRPAPRWRTRSPALRRGARRAAGPWATSPVAITAFTAGHSATLALAVLGVVRAPAARVEVAIAMTLVWLAVELTRRAGGAAARAGVARRPLALPFGFGLLHGLGFATALGEVGVPAREIPLALAGFNVGIEMGQLALVAALLALAAVARRFVDVSSARSLRWTALAPGLRDWFARRLLVLGSGRRGVLEYAVRHRAEEASMTGMVFALLGLAVLAAVVGFIAWRGERTRRLGIEGEVTGLRDAIERSTVALEEKTSERRERGDEVAELRRRLEKAKRRAFSVQEERAPLEARASALETELRDREAECKRLRDEVARLEADVDGARRDAARLREEASVAVQERDKAARVARIDPDEHRSLAHRADAAEEEVRRLNARIRDVERDAMRIRQRERTHRRLYMVIRGELGAAQDRIRHLSGAPPGEAFTEPDGPHDAADDPLVEGSGV